MPYCVMTSHEGILIKNTQESLLCNSHFYSTVYKGLRVILRINIQYLGGISFPPTISIP